MDRFSSFAPLIIVISFCVINAPMKNEASLLKLQYRNIINIILDFIVEVHLTLTKYFLVSVLVAVVEVTISWFNLVDIMWVNQLILFTSSIINNGVLVQFYWIFRFPGLGSQEDAASRLHGAAQHRPEESPAQAACVWTHS